MRDKEFHSLLVIRISSLGFTTGISKLHWCWSCHSHQNNLGCIGTKLIETKGNIVGEELNMMMPPILSLFHISHTHNLLSYTLFSDSSSYWNGEEFITLTSIQIDCLQREFELLNKGFMKLWQRLHVTQGLLVAQPILQNLGLFSQMCLIW